jgi:hypothetical protein
MGDTRVKIPSFPDTLSRSNPPIKFIDRLVHPQALLGDKIGSTIIAQTAVFLVSLERGARQSIHDTVTGTPEKAYDASIANAKPLRKLRYWLFLS